jgi:hypothetical protein
MNEQAISAPQATLNVQHEPLPEVFPHGVFRLEKFHDGETEPYEVLEWENAYVNTGGALLLDLLIAAGGTAFNNANAHLGVGDSSTAVAAAQTDLQAATNKLRKAMNATFPSRAFVWNECALFNASTSGTMLNRIVQSMGTKTSGTWTLTLTLTVP